MATEQGDFDASSTSWTMLGEMSMPGGVKCAKRSVIKVNSDNEHTMDMYFTGPDGQENKGMHIKYVRASA